MMGKDNFLLIAIVGMFVGIVSSTTYKQLQAKSAEDTSQFYLTYGTQNVDNKVKAFVQTNVENTNGNGLDAVDLKIELGQKSKIVRYIGSELYKLDKMNTYKYVDGAWIGTNRMPVDKKAEFTLGQIKYVLVR